MFPILTSLSENGAVMLLGFGYRKFALGAQIQGDQMKILTFIICTIHCFAEGARLAGSLCAAILTGSYAWCGMLVLSLAINLASRTCWVRWVLMKMLDM